MKIRTFLLSVVLLMSCRITETDPGYCPDCPPTGDGDVDAGCQNHVECTTASASKCDEGSCVACVGDGDCSHISGMNRCDSGVCVECVTNADCGDATKSVCRDEDHVCVECTKESEADTCGLKACRLADGQCTDIDRGTLDVCKKCETDSECASGRKCVLHTFTDSTTEESTDVGYFCFLLETEGCGNTVPAHQPYRTPKMATSMDGVAAEYCFPPTTTTCAGISDTQSKSCNNDSSVCGVEGLDDGYCPSIGSGAGLCSYKCGGGVDCRDTLTCAGTPAHCQPS